MENTNEVELVEVIEEEGEACLCFEAP